MNVYAAVILAALLITWVIELAAKRLNLGALTPELPAEFRGVFDAAEYRRAQDYARARARFEIAASTFGLAALLAFWFAGGFEALDRFVRARELPPLGAGLAYVGLLLLLQELASLPFEIYSTFVIEERFGFNKTRWPTFLADKLKVWALTAVVGGGFLAGVLAFFEYAGPLAWLWAWGAACVFRVFLQLAGPTLIMPLFNKFTPLPEGELRAAIFRYAQGVDFPLTNIFVMDGSKRSSKTNAFFTGFGKNKRIALFDTLVAKHSVPELVGVLAHEIGHYQKKHVQKGLLLSLANYGALFYLLSLFVSRPGLFAAFGIAEPSVYAGFVLFGILYSPVSFVLGVFLQAFSRRNEYEADRYAAETTGDPERLVQALKTLSVSNLSNLTPHPFYVFLHYSHPPVLSRIEALRRQKAGAA